MGFAFLMRIIFPYNEKTCYRYGNIDNNHKKAEQPRRYVYKQYLDKGHYFLLIRLSISYHLFFYYAIWIFQTSIFERPQHWVRLRPPD
jgi:hypothetical protein